MLGQGKASGWVASGGRWTAREGRRWLTQVDDVTRWSSLRLPQGLPSPPFCRCSGKVDRLLSVPVSLSVWSSVWVAACLFLSVCLNISLAVCLLVCFACMSLCICLFTCFYFASLSVFLSVLSVSHPFNISGILITDAGRHVVLHWNYKVTKWSTKTLCTNEENCTSTSIFCGFLKSAMD